ncbi:MAG: hypothetical protein VKJ06_02760, partial [Vampirovibrionales bacterium]|nr:hypothetical protein [Vampirovibrionales bacterium]
LAEPTLVLLSGEKASFLAGGEVPIPVIGGNGQVNVEYKEFGIRLNLIATVNDDGKVHLQVAPEVSATDPANSVSTASVSVPGFRTRRMQTTLELNPGESFVLAGLFNSEDSETVSKLPGLGNIPVLGALFRNRTRDQRDNELMVIIQPEVVMVPNG